MALKVGLDGMDWFLGVVKYRVPYTANRDWGIFWCDHFILGVWGSTHQLQRTDQVFAKRVQMQLQSVSELGVHLYGRWGNRRAGWLHLPTLRLPQLRLLPGTQCFNRYCLFIDMFHPSSVCFFFENHRWHFCVTYILSMVLKPFNGFLETLGSPGHHIYL